MTPETSPRPSPPFPDYSCATLHFTRIWTAHDRLLLSGEISETAPDGEGTTLLRVQSDFLRHYFELQRVERSLSTRTRRLRRAGGPATIRQLELERQRLGRELHTGVGQLLAAIRMQLEVIAAQLPGPSLLVQQALARISNLAADALEQVRTISKRLHPPEWQRLTLEAALRQLWEAAEFPSASRPPWSCAPAAGAGAGGQGLAVPRGAGSPFKFNAPRPGNPRRHYLGTAGSGVALLRDNGVGFDVAACFPRLPVWPPESGYAPSAIRLSPWAENWRSKVDRMALNWKLPRPICRPMRDGTERGPFAGNPICLPLRVFPSDRDEGVTCRNCSQSR